MEALASEKASIEPVVDPRIVLSRKSSPFTYVISVSMYLQHLRISRFQTTNGPKSPTKRRKPFVHGGKTRAKMTTKN